MSGTQNLRLLCRHDGRRNGPTQSTLESGRRNLRYLEKRKGRGRKRGTTTARQTAKNSSGRSYGHGPASVGRFGIGFLRGSIRPRNGVTHLICGATKKRGNESALEDEERKKRRLDRPILSMLLHWNKEIHRVKVLLDTGCSIALINQRTTQRLGIPCKKHKNPRRIENFTGETVTNAGQFYTQPMRLQHKKHFSNEQFEVAPMEETIDQILPFAWIERHPPQGAWTEEEIRFNSPNCLEKCTKYETGGFSLTWDEAVATDPTSRIIGHVSTVTSDPTDKVPMEF